MNDIIYDNGMYMVMTGKPALDDSKALVYKVINIETGIIESESSVLYPALFSADDYKKGVEEHRNEVLGRTTLTPVDTGQGKVLS